MLRRLHCHRRDLPILGKALTGSCRSLRTSLPSLYTREDADLLRRHLKIVGEKKKKEGLLALRTDVASDEAGPWQPSFSHLAVALQSLETHRGGAKDKRALFLATTRALRRILLDLHPGAKETSDTRELNTLTKILNLYEKRWMCEASQEVLQIAETVLMREAIVNRVNAVGKLVLLHALVAVPSSDSGAKEEIYWKCLHRALEEGAGGREFSLIECRLAWRVLSRLATRQRKRDGAGVASPEVCSSALSQATVRTRAALERAEKLVGGKEVGASAAACLLTAAIAEAWGNLSSLTGGVSVRENSPPPSFSSPSGTASNSDNEIRQCLEIAGSRLMVLSSDFRFFPAQQTSTLFQVGLELLPSAVAEKALLSAQSFVGVLHELGRDWGPTQAAALVEGLAHQGVARDEVSLGLKNLMRLQSTRTWIDSGVWIRMLALCGQTHEQQQHMGGGVRSLASLQSMVCSFLERSAHSLVREATSLAHSVGLVEAPVTSQWVQILELSESSGTLRPVLVKRARESLAHMNPSDSSFVALRELLQRHRETEGVPRLGGAVLPEASLPSSSSSVPLPSSEVEESNGVSRENSSLFVSASMAGPGRSRLRGSKAAVGFAAALPPLPESEAFGGSLYLNSNILGRGREGDWREAETSGQAEHLRAEMGISPSPSAVLGMRNAGRSEEEGGVKEEVQGQRDSHPPVSVSEVLETQSLSAQQKVSASVAPVNELRAEKDVGVGGEGVFLAAADVERLRTEIEERARSVAEARVWALMEDRVRVLEQRLVELEGRNRIVEQAEVRESKSTSVSAQAEGFAGAQAESHDVHLSEQDSHTLSTAPASSTLSVFAQTHPAEVPLPSSIPPPSTSPSVSSFPSAPLSSHTQSPRSFNGLGDPTEREVLALIMGHAKGHSGSRRGQKGVLRGVTDWICNVAQTSFQRKDSAGAGGVGDAFQWERKKFNFELWRKQQNEKQRGRHTSARLGLNSPDFLPNPWIFPQRRAVASFTSLHGHGMPPFEHLAQGGRPRRNAGGMESRRNSGDPKTGACVPSEKRKEHAHGFILFPNFSWRGWLSRWTPR